MKYRIFTSFKLIMVTALLLSTLTWAGCTKKEFNDRNTDPTRLTGLDPTDVIGLFPSALYAGMNTGPGTIDYQQSQGLFADMFCQYFAGTQTAFASHRYVINQLWVQYQWYSTYVSSMPALVTIIKESNTDATINLKSIARIWKAFVFHRTTDYFGPIPYSKIGLDSTVVPYDSQKDVYYGLFQELTEAVADLKNNISKPSFGDQDMIYSGDNNKWVAFANSLRLRLALRISKVDPQKAQAEAE
ncbi:MAG TPA: SusD/RagB family nutrient-binding outer membrane lipoprotein, partial [Puia sp.]|nr:SusD/RagB family nutrient-binding outer membrane lipoprotein [Puia sp.]